MRAEISGGVSFLPRMSTSASPLGAAHDLVRDALRLLADLVEPAPHEPLHRVDGVLGVGDRLATRDLADQHLALVVPRHHRRRQPPALFVGDDRRVLAIHDGHDGVGGAEVDSDDFAHELIFLFSLSLPRVGFRFRGNRKHPRSGVKRNPGRRARNRSITDYLNKCFTPVVQTWLGRKFGRPTPAQAQAWPLIASGKDVLVTAPTGSGKTLAAFLWALDRLVGEAIAAGGPLPDRTSVLYVSPLKALSNDIRRNLEEPLGEIRALAAELGYPAPEVRTAVRTGDTTARERREATRRPPHVLVTTPESLFILLTSESGRRALRDVRTVIVDEIHAVAADKRGAHLALSLERLEALVSSWAEGTLRRVAAPAASFSGSACRRRCGRSTSPSRLLVGGTRPPPALVDVGQRRDLDLGVEVPRGRARRGRHQRAVGRALRPDRRAGARAQVDAGVRQHAPAGRAGGAAPRRAPGRRRPSPPTTAACRASGATAPSGC